MTVLTLKYLSVLMVLITTVAAADYTNILSKLYRQAVSNNKPLIIILDNNSNGQGVRGADSYRPTNRDQDFITVDHELDDDSVSLSSLVKQLQKRGLYNPGRQDNEFERYGKNKAHFHQSHLRQKLEDNEVIDEAKDEENSKRQKQDSLNSPVVKSLLRLRNSLRCGARDKCQNKCTNIYKGRNRFTCTKQCNNKFVCEEDDYEEDNENGCEDGRCDESENDCSGSCEKSGSTKAPAMSASNECKRCK